ncbi:hypothetical protein VF14_25455 [Nostoc linckia z18]|uniref:DUF5132 domain-containing protein n=3 Tax=Nostoc linckia TaxID=92942 RepID=A0A9Q5Z938_NOSLI|nr:hypothetical protein VF03_37600 [Nostoc linckia z2]PHJ58661.1 hypothetical protein VF05_33495 [Nostoc linckia z3]PHJ62809.1 hypothetical protein VF02_16815 [Nostoc linckia z1]PHJ80264.1 hypothetical protein VF07_32280 [Nostoc linckia z6]PHJ81730.1 hypothetical protein VF06_18960 [Nostoc linckia z4]PHJ93439.1 hypothetical protein VF04_25755 [Nostoc linckia z7]PHJ97222.1 hypothetical protein VF09_35875 [Nostoc linckia z9]PHK00637.1 hypothetical protein VF08_23510 [Nostoc linckia z8]PHK0917
MKVNCLLSSAVTSWLVALAPVPPLAKTVAYGLSIAAAYRLVEESRNLIFDDARQSAFMAMNQELEQLEIALHTSNQEQKLYRAYSAVDDDATYPPEVEQELKTSLEHLYKEPSADHPGETSTSPSTSITKGFYLAVKSLLEVKGETYVIEKVLRLGGGQWAKGKEQLQQILEEGESNGW